jgi:hypothetical protein
MVALNMPVSSDPNSDLANDSVFTQIQKIWERHRKQGLEDRHRTGVLLIKKFGKPGSRQKHGQKILKDYAASLEIAVSELSRMRAFASRFTSLEDMKTQHPNVTTWTQVKNLLVSTRKTETQAAETSTGNGETVPAGTKPVSQALRAIQAVRQCISKVQLAPGGDERAALDEAVKAMLADIEKFLGVRYILENPFPAVIYSPLDDAIRHAPVALAS